MARIRSIKPEFRTSLVVTSWPRDVRLFFSLLWGYLDDFGRGVDEPRLIRADCFPMDDDITAATIDGWLDLMGASGTVVRYTVAGKRYLMIPDWDEHQKPQHPRPSKVPHVSESVRVSPDHEDLSGSSGWMDEVVMTDSGGLHDGVTPEREGRGEEGNGKGNPPTPDADASADPPPKIDKNDRPDVQGACRLLHDLMVENGCKPPTITKEWLDEARLMLDKDARPPEQVAYLLRWSQRSSFWKANIHSMKTFRAKFDTLRQTAEEEWRRSGNADGSGLSRTDVAVLDSAARYQRLKAEAQQSQLAMEVAP